MNKLIKYGIISIAVTLSLSVIYLINTASCASGWIGSGYSWKYDIIGGCKVQVNDKWIQEQRFRAVDE